ncbi:MAG TPA: hypothetical protein DFK12_12995 [Gallionellaceae bacterium]|nr:hypothetical protein [Gallionellaceae bacterium]
MRHFCLPGAIDALARSMGVATAQTRLVALGRSFEGMGASHLRTITGAVALATVAVAANDDRRAAAGAEIVSCGRFHRQ